MSNKVISFSKKLFWYKTATLFSCSTFIFLYSAFFISLRSTQIFWSFVWSIAISCIVQFIIANTIRNFSLKDIDKKLILIENNELNDIQERTKLFLNMARIPSTSGIEAFIYTALTTALLCYIYYKFPGIGIDLTTAKISYIACIFGSYTNSIIIYYFCEKISKPYIENILKIGIDQSMFGDSFFFGRKKTFYGISLFGRCILFLFIPFVFSNILSFFIVKQGYIPINGISFPPKIQIARIIAANIIQITLSLSLIILFIKYMSYNNKQLQKASMELLETGNPSIEIKTTLSDQIQYNVYLLEKVISHYKTLMDNFSNIGKDILLSTENLSTISAKITTSSSTQNNDIKEILKKMETSNELSKTITTKINDIADNTDNTKKEVSNVFLQLRENINHLSCINESNQNVITEINNLASQIDSINEIITLTKDIADQAKIIAINAELESISNNKKKQNFHIIATEIRRLANSTMDSIQKIQLYIETIQNASRELLSASEQSSSFVHEEVNFSKQLESQFNEIMESTNETNEKTTEISGIIEQQTISFNQIVITLRQISSGIDKFEQSTKTISSTVTEMKNIAFKLSNMKEHI